MKTFGHKVPPIHIYHASCIHHSSTVYNGGIHHDHLLPPAPACFPPLGAPPLTTGALAPLPLGASTFLDFFSSFTFFTLSLISLRAVQRGRRVDTVIRKRSPDNHAKDPLARRKQPLESRRTAKWAIWDTLAQDTLAPLCEGTCYHCYTLMPYTRWRTILRTKEPALTWSLALDVRSIDGYESSYLKAASRAAARTSAFSVRFFCSTSSEAPTIERV